jgi:ligand-binding sensor domain-containing protein
MVTFGSEPIRVCGSYNISANKFLQYSDNPIYPDSIKNDPIWAIYKTSDDDLWVSTKAGLYRKESDTGNVKCIIDNSTLGSHLFNIIINSTYEDSRERLWIVTRYNIYCYDIKENKYIQLAEEKTIIPIAQYMMFWKMQMVICGLLQVAMVYGKYQIMRLLILNMG